MITEVLRADEKRTFVFSWLGDTDESSDHTIVLEGNGSEVDVYGVFYGQDSRKYAHTIKVVHKGTDTRAHVFACGIAQDRSFIDFSGMLRVEHGAKRTRTFFRANLMILDKQAGAHTFPGLEIEENDILQGGHAATVGKVNEEQMFYLMSRGLDYVTARKLVIRGFFEPVLAQIGVQGDGLRTKISHLLD